MRGGSNGHDIAVFRGREADYSITIDGDATIVTDLAPGVDGDDGTDTLYGIEELVFLADTGGSFNQDPVASADTASTQQDTRITILAADLLANDSDPDGNPLALASVSNATNGTVHVTFDGNVVFTPDAGFVGTASFDYTVNDGSIGTATATVTVTVLADAGNLPPVALADGAGTDEDTAVTILAADLLANDSDPDNDLLSVASVGNALNGTLSLNVDGDVVFTPDADFTGTASFDYTVDDGNGGIATATVTVTVAPTNDAPVAMADVTATSEDTNLVILSADLLLNDTDVDNDTLAILSVGNAVNGSVQLSGGDVLFTPGAGFNGTASFDYTIGDGNGGTATATVTVDVGAVNDPPLAVDDTAATDEDTAVTILAADLLANDSDPDNDTLSITSVGSAVNGTVSLSGGDVVFTPDADFAGTASFDYTIGDGNGGTATATVTVTVAPVNDAPVAAGTIDDRTVVEGQAVSIDLAGLFTDVDDPNLTYQVTGPAWLTVTGTTLSGTPADGDDGVYAVSVSATDGAAPSAALDFTVTVQDANPTGPTPVWEDLTAPRTFTGQSADTVIHADQPAFDQPAGTIDFWFNPDTVSGNYGLFSRDATMQALPGHLTLRQTGDGLYMRLQSDTDERVIQTGSGVTAGEWHHVALTFGAPGGVALYLNGVLLGADAGFTGGIAGNDNPLVIGANQWGSAEGSANNLQDFFQGRIAGVSIYDQALDAGQLAALIAAGPDGLVNSAPTAVADTAATDEDTSVTLLAADLLANDSDPENDVLAIASVGAAVNGTVALSGGDVVFTPDADFAGTASFDYTVGDGHGGTATATVTVTVAPVNDAPVAGGDVAATGEDTALVIPSADLLAAVTDVDNDTPTMLSVGNAVNGSVELSGGDVLFTPDADFAGTAWFDYTVGDGNGGTATATVMVTVAPVNDAPVAVADITTTSEDTAVTILAADLLANDTDVENDTLTILSVGNAVNGSVQLSGGDVMFTPGAGFAGTASFDYTVDDGNGGTATATVTVTVGAVNDPPLAVDDTAATDEDTPVTILAADLLANDNDPENDTLTIVSVGAAVNGTAVLSGGDVVFTPDADFAGTASFDYTIGDGNGGTATALVTVTVAPVNDAPAAAADVATTDEDTAVTLLAVDLLANDNDPEDDTLTIIAVGGALNGTVALSAGDVLFTPDADFAGTASFDYTVGDGNGGTATATVTVTVVPVNDAPVAIADAATTEADTAVTILSANLLANDGDVENDTLTVASVGNAVNGTVQLSGSNVIFTPTAGFVGTASFDYTIGDGNGGTATATVDVTVTAAPSGQTIVGTDGDDTLTGTAGNDVIEGLNGADTLHGLAGDDTLIGGAGADVLDGGEGSDVYVVGPSDTETISDSGASGTDTIRFTADVGDGRISATFSAASSGIEVIDGTLTSGMKVRPESSSSTVDWDFTGITILGVDKIYGLNGADTIVGSAGNDWLDGNDGTDTLFGGDGDDLLEGDAGDDFLTGGKGDDTHWGGGGYDKVFFHGKQADYSVTTSGSNLIVADLAPDIDGDDGTDTLSSSVEEIVFLGDAGNPGQSFQGTSGGDTLTGAAGNDWLEGFDGDDTLFGLDGDDVLIGGRGNDTLTGGLGFDIFRFKGSDDRDTITDFEDGTDLIDLREMAGVSAYGDLDLVEVGSDVEVRLGGATVVVQGFGLSAFSENDFLI